MKSEPLIVERTYNAKIARVWRAITDISQMQQWYMRELHDFKPVVGFETEFTVHHNGQEFPHIFKVIEVIPEKKIAYDWKFKGNPGASIVSFELFDEGDKTRLILTHVGLESFTTTSDPAMDRSNFQQGWNDLIGRLLKEFVEK